MQFYLSHATFCMFTNKFVSECNTTIATRRQIRELKISIACCYYFTVLIVHISEFNWMLVQCKLIYTKIYELHNKCKLYIRSKESLFLQRVPFLMDLLNPAWIISVLSNDRNAHFLSTIHYISELFLNTMHDSSSQRVIKINISQEPNRVYYRDTHSKPLWRWNKNKKKRNMEWNKNLLLLFGTQKKNKWAKPPEIKSNWY